MPRVVVACRANSKKEWEICFICQEADHAPYVAQEIKNQEGNSCQVGYCEEDDFFNGRHGKIKQVKAGGTLPPPASSVKKFKDEPMDRPLQSWKPTYTDLYKKPDINKPKPKEDSPEKAIPEESQSNMKEQQSAAAKPKSELGMFRKDKKK